VDGFSWPILRESRESSPRSAGTVVSTTALAIREWVFGEWRNGQFAYNTACTNLDKTAIHNPNSDGVILTKSTLESFWWPR
jgi:hypothetical protein